MTTECVAERCVPSVNTALNPNTKLTVVLRFTLATHFGITQCHDKFKIFESHIPSYAMMFFLFPFSNIYKWHNTPGTDFSDCVSPRIGLDSVMYSRNFSPQIQFWRFEIRYNIKYLGISTKKLL
jgi:hypothetical protein